MAGLIYMSMQACPSLTPKLAKHDKHAASIINQREALFRTKKAANPTVPIALTVAQCGVPCLSLKITNRC